MTKPQYDRIYNFDVKHQPIYIDIDIETYIFHEDAQSRIINDKKNMATSGLVTIGTAQDEPDWSTAESNIGDLTGNLKNARLNHPGLYDA